MNAQIDISNTILETNRLILRPWKQSDIHDFFEYASVDGVGQLAGWVPHKTIEDSQTVLNKFIEEKKTFAIVFKENSKVIGAFGIENYKYEEFSGYDEFRCREIGISVSKDYWGQGIAHEAVTEVMRYLFDELNLDYIFYCHSKRNTQSQRVKEKCGFTNINEFTYTTHIGTVEYSIGAVMSRDEWKNRK